MNTNYLFKCYDKKIQIPRPVGVYMCLSVAANFKIQEPGYEENHNK